MKKQDVIDFFNRLAPTWDQDQVYEEEKVNTILDYAGIKEGVSVLDVACGTGVLFDAYLKRNVKEITGIDISGEMIRVASQKRKDSGIHLLCGDAMRMNYERVFDCVMIYNAFPHFDNPDLLFKHLKSFMKDNGQITVAHSMSREKIDAHHSGSAKNVSIGLMEADCLAEIMGKYFTVDTVISDAEKYIVSAHKSDNV